MNDIRRTILWVIFGFSMILLWDQWQIFNGHQATFFPTPKTPSQVEAAKTTAASQVPNAVSTNAQPGVLPVEEKAAAVQTPKFEITTDVLKISVDAQGATIARVEFLKHADHNHPGKNIVLLDESNERVYTAQTGLISGAGNVALPTHKTPMNLRAGPVSLVEGQDKLAVSFESEAVNGVKLVKTYAFKRVNMTSPSRIRSLTRAVKTSRRSSISNWCETGTNHKASRLFIRLLQAQRFIPKPKNTKKSNLKTLRKTKWMLKSNRTMAISPWFNTTLLALGCCPMV